MPQTLFDRVQRAQLPQQLVERMRKYRRSPVYRVLQVLPTPARPWLLTLEALAGWRLDRTEQRHLRREARLERQLSRARSHRRGPSLGRWLILGGLAFAASRLLGPRR